MSSSNSNAIQKTCLLVIFQVIIIVFGFIFMAMNIKFEQTINLELRCMDINNMHKLCISIFQRNELIIPSNKIASVSTLHNHNFKILSFQQNPNKLKNSYKNHYQEYFYLINYEKQLKSIDELQFDIGVKQIYDFLKIENAQFFKQSFNKTLIQQASQFTVFYFLLDNLGPIVPEPQIKITYPTNKSVNLNCHLGMIESFTSIILIVLWTCYQIYDTKKPQNQTLCQNPQVNGTNRPIQFLLNFGMNNIIYLLTLNNFWVKYGLGFVDQTLGFTDTLVPMMHSNSYESFITLFPQWLLLGYFIYLVAQKIIAWSSFKLIIVSGLLSAIIFKMPLYWPQFIFELVAIAIGIFLGSSTKLNSNNKLTIPLVFTAFNLILMIMVKVRWTYSQSQSNDFMLRFFYNQIFIVGTFLSIFFNDDEIAARQHRKYIPYEEYTMEEESFQENQSVPHAEKI